MTTPGNRFRQLLKADLPVCIVGTINAYTAKMAAQKGHQAIYLSGAGCANFSYGLPDLGLTSLADVLQDAQRITSAVSTPLLVDIDTGFGDTFGISRTIREMTKANVAAVHMEDQVAQKRCGHRPNKSLVSAGEMVDRVKSAVDARTDESLFVMARTDAYSTEGLDSAIDRANYYVDAGADGIFAEAMHSLEDYKKFNSSVEAPILANLTEFGVTPLFKRSELASAGIAFALYPLTAARLMNKAAEKAYEVLAQDESQQDLLSEMQTREELYEFLDYLKYEQKIDRLFGSQPTDSNDISDG